MYNNPTIQDFKDYSVFARSFPFGTDINTTVTDADIATAYGQTNFNINPNLFADQNAYTIGYLFLAAHYLVVDLRMASQGINGKYSFLEQSKSVGSVAQAFAIPQRILDDPYFSMLVTTNYGAKYLSLLLPQLAGNVFTVFGRTLP